MPHFTLQIGPDGPMLNAAVGVSEARRAALVAAGQAVPQVVRIRALVDTGASCTCIDPSVPAQLQLTPTGSVTLNTPTTGNAPETRDQYDVSLLIPGANAAQTPLVLRTLPIVASDLLPQGFHALIGRDILEQCVLTYNGTMAWFTLAF